MHPRTKHRALALPCLLASVLGLLGCNTRLSTAPVLSQLGTTTTIILVRHAEREPGLDPTLNAEGRQRAVALDAALAENGVTAIYTLDLARNRETAQRIADRFGIEVNLVGAAQAADTRALANWFVDQVVEKHAGGMVLWIGNTGPVVGEQSGNLQEIYTRLGGTGTPPIRYQDMYIAVIPEDGAVRFIKTQYGGESSLD